MTLTEIGQLTDRQIHDLYFHPRTEDGEIKPVQAGSNKSKLPQSLEEELLQLDRIHAALGKFGGIKDYDQAVAKIKAKWA